MFACIVKQGNDPNFLPSLNRQLNEVADREVTYEVQIRYFHLTLCFSNKMTGFKLHMHILINLFLQQCLESAVDVHRMRETIECHLIWTQYTTYVIFG